MSVSRHIQLLLSREEYAFSLDEIEACYPGRSIAIRRELSRLVRKQAIQNLRKGFYLIIPPRYSTSSKLPIQLYVNKLFNYLERQYYIGLYSASKIHGASHQQIHQDYIIIETPKLNDINKYNYNIRFFTNINWPKNNIAQLQSDAGIYNISSPALTFFDLIHHHRKIGGFNRVLIVLEELFEEITENDMRALLSWYKNNSTIQRAGFIIEELVGRHNLSEMIYEKLSHERVYPVLLSPDSNDQPRRTENKWRVSVNMKLEFES